MIRGDNAGAGGGRGQSRGDTGKRRHRANTAADGPTGRLVAGKIAIGIETTGMNI